MIEIIDSAKKIDSMDIVRVENLFGFDLPEDYKSFLLKFNGGRPKPSTFDFIGVDNLKNSTDIRIFFSIRDTEKKADDLENNIAFYWDNERLAKSVIPIAADFGGNLISMSISGDNYGKIFFWDHEFELELDDDENLAKLADSFTDFIDTLHDNADN